jgi:hypothetical protein
MSQSNKLNQLFEIRLLSTTTNNNEFGVFATQYIPSNAIILQEHPILQIPRYIDAEQQQQNNTYEIQLQQDFLSLDESTKLQLLQLSHGITSPMMTTNLNKLHSKDILLLLLQPPLLLSTLKQIIEYNAMPLGTTSNAGGIFLQCSRFNHSCNPNALYRYNNELGMMEILSTKDIQPNEEICVCYILLEYLLLPVHERKQYIWNELGFNCQCEKCTLL